MTGDSCSPTRRTPRTSRARTPATPAGTARGTSRRRPAGSSPTSGSSAGRSADRTVARDAVRAADEQREAVGRDRLVAVAADLEVPARGVAAVRPADAPGAEAADRDAGELAVVEDRQVDAGVPDVVARDADAAPPGGGRDGRPVDRAARAPRRVGRRRLAAFDALTCRPR